MNKEVKLSYRTQELVSNIKSVPEKCFSDLSDFRDLLISLRKTASNQTHYHNLNEWSDRVYEFVHKKLKENKFKNGDPEANDKNPGARFWWNVYGIVGAAIYSRHLKTNVSNHHSSAFERNEALILELEDAIKFIENRPKLEYEVQYSENKEKLWVHCSTGETVGRFDTRFGMDIHTTIEEQNAGSGQCLHCTHGKSNPEDFDLFCKKAKELWGVEIDRSKIQW
jgi:hypothetical protein